MTTTASSVATAEGTKTSESPTPLNAEAKPTWRNRVAFLAPPVVTYLISTGVFWLFAALSGATFFSTADRFRWDSFHYLNIARNGYEMFRCGDRFPNHYRPDIWCGDAAWFPLYSMVVRAVSALGFSYEMSAVLVTEISLLGMFIALWWLLGAQLNVATTLCLALAIVFPGSIYFHAAFPIALGTLGLLACLIGIKKDSWWIAGLGAAVASSTHLVGAVSIGVLALSAVFAWQSHHWPVRIAKAAGAAAIGALGLLWTGWLMYQGTGRWDAYSETQRVSYGQGDVKNPFTSLKVFYDYQLPTPAEGTGGPLTSGITEVLRDQLTLNIALMALVILVTGIRVWKHRRLDAVDCAALLITIAIFVMPFFGGAWLSWYRNHAQMFVALVLLRDAPRWVQGLLIAVCAMVTATLSAGFFYGSLV
ncbi:MAG: hypothetical protein HOQ05_05350 [Corynebacteriales bacterium]|nr:hypothetical protein [Mycobacteriales bacterium]